MTHEERAHKIVGEWATQFDAAANGGAGAFGELIRRISAGMAEASNAELERKRAVDWTGQVEAFMRAGGQEIPERPRFPGWYVERLRVRLIKEELEEIKEALGSCDITEVADGVIDLLYVVIGMGLAFGLPMRELFAEVHRSNMAKAGPDGKFQMRADGKITKPEGWQGPRIAEILRHHGAAVEAPR